MNVLGADSMILGTRKLWWMFQIKQKLNIKAVSFYNKNVLNQTIFFDSPLCCFFHTRQLLQACCTMVKKPSKFAKIQKFWLSKKAAVVWNFCLIGNIHQNFLIPRMNESDPKAFMPIQTQDLHRVHWRPRTGHFSTYTVLSFEAS